MLGVILAGAGGYNLYSDIVHQFHGRPATATLMAHITQCTVEYQRIGEQERKDRLPCELAEEFQRRVGSNKVKLSRDYIARVKFVAEDGRAYEASVDDIKLGSYGLAIGTTLPVIYTPENPADVRARMSWQTLQVPLILLGIGLPFLALSLAGPLMALFGSGSRGRAQETMTATADHLAPATPVPERRGGKIVQRMAAAQTAADNAARPTGTAPRTSFGMRNR